MTVVDGTLGALVTTKRGALSRAADRGRPARSPGPDEESFPEGDDTAPGSPPTRRAGTARTGVARATAPTGLTTLDAGGITMRAVDKRFVEGNYDIGYLGRQPDDGSVIDIMVVYTDMAHYGSDSPYAPPSPFVVDVQLAIDAANLSFVDSGIQTHLNLVNQPFEVNYVESGYMEVDRTAVRDGLVAGVLEARELLAADVVVLVTAYGSGSDGTPLCGKAKVKELGTDPLDNAADGFLVVKSACLGATHTLAHEVGHTLGAAHDW